MVLNIGSELGDRYEIISRIGSGGMSDVYKARDIKLNRSVAVKVLKDEYAADLGFVEKFRMEARAAACLSHPNIVNIYDVGEDSGIYYIVMELIEGITLKRYIEKKGKLGIREAIEVAMQVAHGLIAAHGEKIVHRDIKPQNIMISREGKVKVTDFGIARRVSAGTVDASTMGSVHYISPEQATGGSCDERSDIYSLGIMLYEMLTGVVPFDGENSVAVAMQHVNGEMVPPRQIDPAIPAGLEKVIFKCTQKDPADRYDSAQELLDDLKRVITSPGGVSGRKPAAQAPDMIPADSSAGRRTGDDAYDDKYGESLYQRGEEAEEARPHRKAPVNASREAAMIDAKERRFEKFVTAAGIVVAIAIVIVVSLIVLNIVGVLDFGGGGTLVIEEESQIEIPDLRGKTYEEANELLSEYGITIKATYGVNTAYNDGAIYDQDVEVGTLVTSGAIVNVVINIGENSLTIPAGVTDELPETVTELLKNAGFTNINSEYYYENSDSVTEGRVIRLDPESGSEVAPDASITIVVSKGPSFIPIAVPDVLNDTKDKARETITAAKLDIKIKEEYSDSVSAGLVIRQVPAAGTEVSEGTTITLVISKGRESFEMPNLYGLTEEEAIEKITSLGLEVGSVDAQFCSEDLKDRVIGQDPVYDTVVKAGDKVDIYIGLGPEPEETSAEEEETTAEDGSTEAEGEGESTSAEEGGTTEAEETTSESSGPEEETTTAEAGPEVNP